MERNRSSHHPAKFCGHKQCSSGDMILVCHVISQDPMIQGSFDFMSEIP